MSLFRKFRWSAHAIATFLLLAATLAASRVASERKPGFLAQPLETIDRNIAGLTSTAANDAVLDDRVLAQLRPSTYLIRSYKKPGLSVELFIAFYAQQRAGESMHSPKHCLPGSGWEIWDHGVTEIASKGTAVKINRYSISKEAEKMVVLYWYQSKGRIIASEYLGKVLLARDALLQNSTAASIVRISVPDQPAAVEEARVFAGELMAQVQRCFGRDTSASR